ncbi:hypothetical protein C4K23_4011 [Pseudomonas chlororaphis]|nr:hypothetical protein C4K23_4011 [Pseudomonas chlororaphis]
MPVQVQRLCYLGRTSEAGGKLGPVAGLRGGLKFPPPANVLAGIKPASGLTQVGQ